MAKDCNGKLLAPGDAVSVPCVVERTDGDKVFLETVGVLTDGGKVTIALLGCCVEKDGREDEDDATPYVRPEAEES